MCLKLKFHQWYEKPVINHFKKKLSSAKIILVLNTIPLFLNLKETQPIRMLMGHRYNPHTLPMASEFNQLFSGVWMAKNSTLQHHILQTVRAINNNNMLKNKACSSKCKEILLCLFIGDFNPFIFTKQYFQSQLIAFIFYFIRGLTFRNAI